MEIIAITEKGCLISATNTEVSEILNAVCGKKPEKLIIGQKIPAIDYATTIIKIKSLKNEYSFMEMMRRIETFNTAVASLESAVNSASDIDL